MIKFFWVSKEKEDIEVNTDINIFEDIEEELWQIALDIVETSNEVIIMAPIAWIELDDIDLTINKNVLTIKWFREKPKIYWEEIIIRNTECFWWKFLRNIILPENLDFDSIKASLENNLLIITIQKLKFSKQNIKIDRVEI